MSKTLNAKFTRKQAEVYNAFLDPEILEILVWGWGRGWKTWGISEIINLTCCSLPGIAWLVWRRERDDLRKTSLNTLLKAMRKHWMKEGYDFNLNFQTKELTYANGSKIFLVPLKQQPSDLEFNWLGGYEITHAFIDEAQEVERKAIDVVKSRLTEKIKEYDLVGKVIMWCNPMKGHLYTDFIKPQKEGKLPGFRKFIQILYKDNPYLDHKKFEESMQSSNNVTKQRLLYGNWEYDDTPGRLYAYDDILDMRTNPITNWKKYIIWDPARLGEDEAWIMVFNGWEEIETVIFGKCTLDVYRKKVQELAQKHKINMSNVLIDADGVWGGIVDEIRCKPFHNGGSPIQTKEMKQLDVKANFENLKTQCYFELQNHIKKIRINTEVIKEKLTEELDVIVEIDIDKDGKRKINKKEAIKEQIWRSPNGSDCLAMRCWFELDPPTDYSVLKNYALS